ncbi:glycosyltransferase family 4 protein [Lactobacillus delbrueckii]|uniref:glycosyltransferase family 4 protein n=1 Tax=Lactobacillus delbrueckii TaxID=1584 RepID=UPI003A8B5419
MVGKMSYQPNIEGVLWFYHNVWSIVKEKYPDGKLYIVGKDPVESLTEIDDKSVVVTGTVDSVEPYYANSAVVAIPIFSGGGVKTKLIEAASYGLPIITTPSGVLGTNFTNEQQVIVTEDPVEFAQGIVAALDNDQHQQDLAKNAHELFVKEYTWSGICQQMSEFFENLVE